MDTFKKQMIWLALGLNILSIILSSYGWAQNIKLSLPLPLAVLIISTFFPILTSALAPFVTRYFRARKYGFSLLTILAYLLSLLPLILIVLAFVYGLPSSLFTCSLQSRWHHLFQLKNAQAIRAIQDTLQCCGLNSVRDQAWPFPSNTIDAGACQRTQGWNVRCLERWSRQASTTAGIVGLANLSNWALVILLAYITHMRPLGLPLLRPGRLGSNHGTRPVGALESGDEEVQEESGGRPGHAYYDVADSVGGQAHEDTP